MGFVHFENPLNWDWDNFVLYQALNCIEIFRIPREYFYKCDNPYSYHTFYFKRVGTNVAGVLHTLRFFNPT